MWLFRVVLVSFVFLIIFIGLSKAYIYKGTCEDDEVFNDCQNQPDGVLNVHGLFNFSEYKYELSGEEIFASGNLTSIWNIQPSDRVQVIFQSFLFIRLTIFKILYFSLMLKYFASIVVYGIQLSTRWVFLIFVHWCTIRINIGTSPGPKTLQM